MVNWNSKEEYMDQAKPCKFPFKFESQKFSECIKGIIGMPGKHICPLENENGDWFAKFQYGYCPASCESTSGVFDK